MLRVHNPWSEHDEGKKYDNEANVVKGYIFGAIFLFLATVNIISVTRTIFTPPGAIPEYKEWDMPSEAGESDMEDEDERRFFE